MISVLKSVLRNVLLGSGALSCAALAAGPEPAGMPTPIPKPVDRPYPGVIRLSVDATDLDRHILQMHETLPVRGAGPMVLLYPCWLPAFHAPVGRTDRLAGLIIHAGEQRLEWVRDSVDMFAFHILVPPGSTALDVDFQYLSPVTRDEGRAVLTPDMEVLEWGALVLYPAGYFSRQITLVPSVRLPTGWGVGTALETASTEPGAITFKPVTLNILEDSPVVAGRYFERVDLDPGAAVPVHLDVVADRPELLVISAEELATHRALIRQADKLYGSHHYDHYDFLLVLGDQMSSIGGLGIENHRSSENITVADYFTDWDKSATLRYLLPHEYSHSWNGKFRRPADLWTPNFVLFPGNDDRHRRFVPSLK